MTSNQYLGDERMLDLAKRLLEHVLKQTAIRDCRCAACSGFKEEAPQWIEMLGFRPAVETFARQPGDCEHERASVKCPDCGIDFIGTLMVSARHTLDCAMVKHPNCTRCNCGSSVDPNSSWHARQSPPAGVPATGAPTGPESLVGALQDRVHKEIGVTRAAHAVKPTPAQLPCTLTKGCWLESGHDGHCD